MKNLGVVLIVIGIGLIVITGFNFTTQEKVVDLGPIEINKEVDHPIQWSPIAGGIIIVGGIALILTGRKKNLG